MFIMAKWKKMARLICWAIELYNLLTTGLRIEGHAYVEVEHDVYHLVLQCSRCDHESIGYYKYG